MVTSLAYAEMRLILAKIVFNFEVSLEDDSKDFINKSTAHSLWNKPPLNMHVKPYQK
jgi:hypothetical protein